MINRRVFTSGQTNELLALDTVDTFVALKWKICWADARHLERCQIIYGAAEDDESIALNLGRVRLSVYQLAFGLDARSAESQKCVIPQVLGVSERSGLSCLPRDRLGIVENVLLHLMQRKMKHLIGLRRVFNSRSSVLVLFESLWCHVFPSAIIRKWWFSTNCASFASSANGKVSEGKHRKVLFCSAKLFSPPHLRRARSAEQEPRTVNEQKFIQIKSHSRWINQSLEGNVPTTRRHLVHQLYWLEFRNPSDFSVCGRLDLRTSALPSFFFREIKLKTKKTFWDSRARIVKRQLIW